MYNTNYYKDEKMLQLKPYAEAIHTFKTGDGTIIAIFQGNRGDNPELDFRVKYLNDDPNARPVQLPHVDWVVDLLIKAQKKDVLTYVFNTSKRLSFIYYFIYFFRFFFCLSLI